MRALFTGLLLSAIFGAIGCSEQGLSEAGRTAKPGDTVMVHYTGKLPDGTVVDSTEGQEPLGIVVGQGAVLPVFEQALIGMSPGEVKSMTVAPEEAFGPYHDDASMIVTLDRSTLAHSLDLEVGQRLNAAVFYPDEPEKPVNVPVTVIDVNERTVTVDANHPLAGKELRFEIRLVKIR